MRCVVQVAVGTRAIRALFADERPAVLDADWNEAHYVAQRLQAYAEALDALALVRPLPADAEYAADESLHEAAISCPRTGDRVFVDVRGAADPLVVEAGDASLRLQLDLPPDIERAVRRVFADANAWRRNLLPGYFERHRAWRSVVGAPIQH